MTDLEAKAAQTLTRGASRAAGERARRRRRTTPLLAQLEPDFDNPSQPAVELEIVAKLDVNAAVAEAVETVVAQTVADLAVEADVAAEVAADVEPVTDLDAELAAEPAAEAPATAKPLTRRRANRRTPGGKRLVVVADLEEAVQAAAEQAAEQVEAASGGGPQALEKLAGVFDFVKHRLAGSYPVDEFGFDPEFTDTVFFGVLRVLYRKWFRVEVSGIENIPSDSGALLVSNHAGTVAVDALMLALAVHDEHPAHRFVRSLGADMVFETPLVGEVARRTGATLANNADAERLLGNGELVVVFPEGFKGVGKPFSERYKLQRFGRGGFVSAALRARVPIIPVSIVGSEEIYPMIGDIPALARLIGMPYVPITPFFPMFGPLGMVPLPSKWLIDFGAPVKTDGLGEGAAEDPMLVFDITDQVRQTIQQNLYQLLVKRRTVFF